MILSDPSHNATLLKNNKSTLTKYTTIQKFFDIFFLYTEKY